MYSIIDMILNPEYREKTYKYYNDKYEESQEEKEIFKAWQKRYRGC